MAQFPALREFMRTWVEDYRSRNGLELDDAVSQICRAADVGESALQSWRSGARRPSAEAIAKLVDAIPEVSQKEVFRAELVRACEARHTSWEERVVGGEISLQIRAAHYEGAGEFWDRIMARLLDSAKIRYNPNRVRNLDFLQVREELWSAGGPDLALGLLATPEFLVKLHFFQSPVRYRVNAVVTTDVLDSCGLFLDQLQHALSPDPLRSARADFESLKEKTRFVVMKGEIGHTHLAFVDPTACSEDGMVSRLVARAFVKQILGHDRNAIAFADEITCLKIISGLREEGVEATLVFPLRSGDPAEVATAGARLPEFPLSVAVGRNLRAGLHTKELIEYLGQALELFLPAHSNWVAREYLLLRNQIRELARQALGPQHDLLIERWLGYVFRLSPSTFADDALVPGSWRAVLTAARALDMIAPR